MDGRDLKAAVNFLPAGYPSVETAQDYGFRLKLLATDFFLSAAGSYRWFTRKYIAKFQKITINYSRTLGILFS